MFLKSEHSFCHDPPSHSNPNIVGTFKSEGNNEYFLNMFKFTPVAMVHKSLEFCSLYIFTVLYVYEMNGTFKVLLSLGWTK